MEPTCSICGASFRTHGELSYHIFKSHGNGFFGRFVNWYKKGGK